MKDKEENPKGKEEPIVTTFDETNPDGDNPKTPGKKKPPSGG